MRSADTSPEAHAVHMAAYRAMTPQQRVALALDMSEDVLAMAADGIRSRHPDYDEDQVSWALLRLRHGDDIFRAVWPAAPFLTP